MPSAMQPEIVMNTKNYTWHIQVNSGRSYTFIYLGTSLSQSVNTFQQYVHTVHGKYISPGHWPPRLPVISWCLESNVTVNRIRLSTQCSLDFRDPVLKCFTTVSGLHSAQSAAFSKPLHRSHIYGAMITYSSAMHVKNDRACSQKSDSNVPDLFLTRPTADKKRLENNISINSVIVEDLRLTAKFYIIDR